MIVGPTSSCSLLFTLPSFSPSRLMGKPDHLGMRQAPECLDSVHISARLWELAQSRKSALLQVLCVCGNLSTCFSTYNTAGWREAIVSTSSPLPNLQLFQGMAIAERFNRCHHAFSSCDTSWESTCFPSSRETIIRFPLMLIIVPSWPQYFTRT